MKKISFLISLIVFCGHTVFAQAPKTKMTQKPAKPGTVKPVAKKAVIAKTKTGKPAKPFLKIPAKTGPSVLIKTRIRPKKVVIKEKPAPLPGGVNKNENAVVVPAAREIEMINEINLLRKNPAAYIPFVENYMKLNRSNKDIQGAGRELIKELKTISPLTLLTLNPVMYSAAKQFGQQLKSEDNIEHSDLPYVENLIFGHADIREAILDLLVDDGEPERGHRRNLLNSSISKIAVYEIPGELQGYQNCFIQEFK